MPAELIKNYILDPPRVRVSLLWELIPRFGNVEVGCTSVLRQLASPITTPGALSRSQKNQVWMQRLNFLWEVVIMPCLLAEDISGLVQRTSDSTLISLQCVWSMLMHLQHSSVFVHVKRTLVSIETRHFLARMGFLVTHPNYYFTLGRQKAAGW